MEEGEQVIVTATLEGDGANAGGSFCGLFGVTVPFSTATLASLYPSHADYAKKFDRATNQAIRDGFLLPLDAKNLEDAAARASSP